MVCKLNAGKIAARYKKMNFKVFNVFEGHQFTSLVRIYTSHIGFLELKSAKTNILGY